MSKYSYDVQLTCIGNDCDQTVIYIFIPIDAEQVKRNLIGSVIYFLNEICSKCKFKFVNMMSNLMNYHLQNGVVTWNITNYDFI